MTLLRERGIHRLPVTRDGRIVGIVTGSNILLALLAQVESAAESGQLEEFQPLTDLVSAGVDGD